MTSSKNIHSLIMILWSPSVLMQKHCVADCQSGSWGSVGAIFVAHDSAPWRGLVDGCIYFNQCRQLTWVCVSIGVCVCVYVRHCGYTLTKASNCAAHGLLASDPSWSLVWNVIYLCCVSPCALKTKIFIELHKILRYSLAPGSTHSALWLCY